MNDNSPVFPERRISHEISELAEPGTALAVPAATDLDSGRNGIYRYDVIPRDGKFELTSRATADGSTDLRLVLRERLDRELEDRYLVYRSLGGTFMRGRLETETLKELHLVVTCTRCLVILDLRVRKTPRQMESTGIETETLGQTSSGYSTASRS